MPPNATLLEGHKLVRQQPVQFLLSDRTKVQLTGADRAAFLHNFCTNDIKNLAIGRGCEAFLCSAKGKTLAYFRVFAFPDALWLDAAPGIGPKIVQHLERYVISEDVAIVDRTGQMVHQLVIGALEGLLEEVGTSIPSLNDQSCALLEDVMICRDDMHGLLCHHLFWPRDAFDPDRILRQVGQQHQALNQELYETLRVEAGFPEYGRDIDESNYPQEVGRDARTISFTKGCYLGQEPIVMIRDRGQVSRLLVGLKLSGDEPAAPGTPLTSAGKEVGRITSSVWSPLFKGPIALGYVRRGLHEPGTRVQVTGVTGEAVVTTLPFGGTELVAGQPR